MDELLVGEFHVDEEDRSRVSIRLSETATLCIHKSDEGIVLDVWDPAKDKHSTIWTTYFFDTEMMGENDG